MQRQVFSPWCGVAQSRNTVLVSQREVFLSVFKDAAFFALHAVSKAG
jgi:hypothetical protein